MSPQDERERPTVWLTCGWCGGPEMWGQGEDGKPCEQCSNRGQVLVEASALRALRPEGGEPSALERFEREAEAFYDATGYMAPGKDVPAAMGATSDYEMRRACAWEAWCAGVSYGARRVPSVPSGETRT